MTKPTKPTQRNNDIFDVLGAINRKEIDYYDTLDSAKQSEIQPYVLQRWMYGTPYPLQLILLNEVVNPYIFSLQNHKPLLWKLLCITAQRSNTKYTWKKFNTLPKDISDAVVVISRFHNVSLAEARYLAQRYTLDDINQMKDDLGISQ